MRKESGVRWSGMVCWEYIRAHTTENQIKKHHINICQKQGVIVLVIKNKFMPKMVNNC